jgi:hypothetical protein
MQDWVQYYKLLLPADNPAIGVLPGPNPTISNEIEAIALESFSHIASCFGKHFTLQIYVPRKPFASASGQDPEGLKVSKRVFDPTGKMIT